MKRGSFGRAISNFSKVLFSSGNGFLKIIINSKRNSLIKLYENYADYTKVTDENKRNTIVESMKSCMKHTWTYLTDILKKLYIIVYKKVLDL